MDFNAQQMRSDALLKDGKYKFTVVDARESKSQAGNQQINLKLSLSIDDRRVTYFDRLILLPKMFWKVEHFCKAAKMPEKIDQGKLADTDCVGKEGYIHIIQKANSQTGELENQTKDYVTAEEGEAQEMFNDEIVI